MGRGLYRNAIGLPTKVSGAIVAFQADRENDRSLKQPRVGRSMRGMTRLATVHSNGRVLIEKRSAFIRMALQARLLVLQSGVH